MFYGSCLPYSLEETGESPLRVVTLAQVVQHPLSSHKHKVGFTFFTLLDGQQFDGLQYNILQF